MTNQQLFNNVPSHIFDQKEAPIVSQLQAIDQYGNIIATAQNPNLNQMLKQTQ